MNARVFVLNSSIASNPTFPSTKMAERLHTSHVSREYIYRMIRVQ